MADVSALYDGHAERVLVFLVRRCLDPEVAVDLLAETFAQAFTSRRGFAGRSAAEAGARLFAIARQQLYAYFDRGRVEQKALRRLGIEVPPVNRDDSERIGELAALTEVRGVVRERFDRLPAGPRAAVQLRVIEQLPYAELAHVLAVPEDTARAQVSSGLRMLSRLTVKRQRTRTPALADPQQRSPGEAGVLVALGREFDRAVEKERHPSRWGQLGLRQSGARAGVLAFAAVLLAVAAVVAATGWLLVGGAVPAGPP
ncbi:MAG: RNA polymerase sigma factor [Actinomycetota bacterium]|nr:RNA polymerase sigma factor [Actinomycetota bacterium]